MNRTLVIAEAGVNHGGSLPAALELVDAAVGAGADVVKFQTFDARSLATATAPQAAYQRRNAAAASQIEMLTGLQLDRDAHDTLAARCAETGIEFLSTAFDEVSLGWLLELGIRRVKVPSGELTNGPLVLAFARTGLPLIVSTGMASLADIEGALAVIAFGAQHAEGVPTPERLREAYTTAARDGSLREWVTLLHCTSSYPADPSDVHLAAMDTLAQAFALPVGYSDHTLGTAVSIGAVARGARVVEKHLTLDRDAPGPDHAASLEPDGFTELVAGIRAVEAAIGSPVKYPTAAETDTVMTARRSVVAARPIAAGQVIAAEDLRAARPGTGRPPADLWHLPGRTATRDYGVDEPLDARE
ncbi:N-acetylneuraminate synthase [Nitriliruptor alkaliphilus]|uniref:N-acetylneuraminate synthase n=1 Tax=Nitriliruptor alkaliphilus TaxID=427918 RepID=UPI000696300D|nr:N-acetylneuraminate synthase [Nitriliruptor alkaliphilus]